MLPLPLRTPIGIDVDARCLAAVQLAGSRTARRVTAAAVLSRLEPTPVPTADELARLSDALGRQGFIGHTVVLAVPSSMLMSSVLELPAAGSGAPRAQIARMELARMHRHAPNAFECAFWDLPERSRGEGSEALAAACTVEDSTALLDAFETAGFDVAALDVESLAAARACGPLIADQPGMSVLLALRWDTASLAIVHQTTIVYARLLPELGLLALHDVLVKRLQLEPYAAEFVLLEGGLGDGAVEGAPIRETRRLIEKHLETLLHEVEVSCSYVAHRYPESAGRSLHLIGPGAAMPGLPAHIESETDFKVNVTSPVSFAACPDALGTICTSPALTSAAGLALHGT